MCFLGIVSPPCQWEIKDISKVNTVQSANILTVVQWNRHQSTTYYSPSYKQYLNCYELLGFQLLDPLSTRFFRPSFKQRCRLGEVRRCSVGNIRQDVPLKVPKMNRWPNPFKRLSAGENVMCLIYFWYFWYISHWTSIYQCWVYWLATWMIIYWCGARP